MLLNKDIRTVMLQLFVSPDFVVPKIIEKRIYPVFEKSRVHQTGELTIDHQLDCSASDFPEELEVTGYRLNCAYWQDRKSVLAIRFLFALGNYGYFPQEIIPLREALQSIMKHALWEVWAYQDLNRININFGSRHFGKPASHLYILNRVVQVEIS